MEKETPENGSVMGMNRRQALRMGAVIGAGLMGTLGSAGTTAESSDDGPLYHYAFNIPENKIEAARQWQKQRTPLIRRGKSEIVHFSGINVHSVYFTAPAGNIVDYTPAMT